MKKRIGVFLIVLGIMAGLLCLYLFEKYSAISPNVPVVANGQVIEKNNHGHLFFVTRAEDNLMWHLILAAFIMLPIGGLLLKANNPK